jgi:hypothetical protein
MRTQVKIVLHKHEAKSELDFSNDDLYRRMVSESLQTVTMANSMITVCAFAMQPFSNHAQKFDFCSVAVVD